MRGGVFWTWRNALANVPRTPDPQPAARWTAECRFDSRHPAAFVTVFIERLET